MPVAAAPATEAKAPGRRRGSKEGGSSSSGELAAQDVKRNKKPEVPAVAVAAAAVGKRGQTEAAAPAKAQPAAAPAAAAEVLPLYDRIGGKEGIQSLVFAVYDMMKADAETAPFFERFLFLQRLKDRTVDYFVGTWGGPDPYEGLDMWNSHAGLEITEMAYDVMAKFYKRRLREMEVSPDVFDDVMKKIEDLKTPICDPGRKLEEAFMKRWQEQGKIRKERQSKGQTWTGVDAAKTREGAAPKAAAKKAAAKGTSRPKKAAAQAAPVVSEFTFHPDLDGGIPGDHVLPTHGVSLLRSAAAAPAQAPQPGSPPTAAGGDGFAAPPWLDAVLDGVLAAKAPISAP